MRVLAVMSDHSVKQLLSLSKRKKLAFLVLLCDRMLPSLYSFCILQAWDFTPVKTARDAFWRSLQDGAALRSWHQLRQDVDKLLPDTEEFQSTDAVLALHAGCLVEDIGDFIIDGTDECFEDAIMQPLNSLRHHADLEYGGVAHGAAVEEYASSHPLILREKRTEERDVVFLQELQEPPWLESTIATLRERAAKQATLFEPYAH
jgi:uncharacterized protein YjaG (DUF416 family)